MNSIRKALNGASTTTVKRLGMVSLLLVLVLTTHGLWLLHASEVAAWERRNRLATVSLVAHTELLLDFAASTLDAVELQLQSEAAVGAGSRTSGALPALSALGPLARLDLQMLGAATPSSLAQLEPYGLYRTGKGPSTTYLSPMRSEGGEPLLYVWKELPNAPQGVSRIGVALPERVLKQASTRIQSAFDAHESNARITLLREDGTQLLASGGFQQTADPADLVHKEALERARLVAEVRLSHALVANSWAQTSSPLYAVVFLGTGLLIISLLVLTRVVSRQEREALELAEVRNLAHSANRSKGLFHAAMSHELTVPLSGIIATAKLMQADIRRPDMARLISVVLMSARNLQAVVREILDRSREESAVTPRKAPCTNPLAVGTEVVDLFYASAVAQGVDLTFVTASPPCPIAVDAFDLRQVLANLVGNALKHTKRGSIVVSCTMAECNRSADFVGLRFEVRDTGCGMSGAEVRALFRPISQVADEKNGGGLGLPLARLIVRGMGGDLQVESSPGVGTRFWFNIEARIVKLVPPGSDGLLPQLPSVVEKTKHARILVVEDNPVSALVTETQLHALGYACEVSPDGEGALAAMAVGGYDLVLMDCTLPGLSGHDITQHWRAFEKQNGVKQPLPIIALTAKAMSGHMQQCLDVGMSDFLTKPCAVETLGRTIEMWLSVAQRNRP